MPKILNFLFLEHVFRSFLNNIHFFMVKFQIIRKYGSPNIQIFSFFNALQNSIYI